MSADYTPSMHNYKNMGHFKMWCQKVLPLVYDDSLSYYEVLCKVIQYINDTTDNVDGLYEDMQDLYSAYNLLQTYVNTYFDNLNVQTEINNKLDAMVLDGTMDELLSPIVGRQIGGVVAEQIGDVVGTQIGAVVANQLPAEVATQLPDIAAQAASTEVGSWLETHIDPDTGYVIDDTLTVSNAAADAKAVGDNLTELKSALSYNQKKANSSSGWINFSYTFIAGHTYKITNTSGYDITYTQLWKDGAQVQSIAGGVTANSYKEVLVTKDADTFRFFGTNNGVILVEDKEEINARVNDLELTRATKVSVSALSDAVGNPQEKTFSFASGLTWAQANCEIVKNIPVKIDFGTLSGTNYLKFIDADGNDIPTHTTYTSLAPYKILTLETDAAKIAVLTTEAVTVSIKYDDSMMDTLSDLNGKILGDDAVDYILPTYVPIAAGIEMNVYYQNILRYADATQFEKIDSNGVWGYAKDFGRITAASDVSTSNRDTNIYFYGNKNASRVTKKIPLQVKYVAANAGSGVTKKVLFIGDSLTAAGVYPNEIVNMFSDDVMNVELLGSLQSANAPYAHHEGRGGWRAYTYCRCEYGNEDVASLPATLNPFYNTSTQKFDFTKYMTDQSYTDVDYVFINLGKNDVAPSRPDHQTDADILEYWNEMITSIHTYDANIKIVLWLSPTNSMMFKWNRQLIDVSLRINRLILDNFNGLEAQNIYLCAPYLNVDPAHDYPYSMGYVSARNTDDNFKVAIGTDYEHPSAYGYYKIADVIYSFIKYLATL